MATLATPPPATTEVAPASSPQVSVTPPQVFQDAASRMAHLATQRLQAAAPPVTPPAETPPQTETSLVDPAAPAPVETAPAEPATPEIDLEGIDFDAAEPATAASADAETPVVADTPEKWQELQKAIESGSPDDVLAKLYSTSKGRKTLETMKILREAEKPVSDDGAGGIGHFPTLDEIKLGYAHTQHITGMLADAQNDPVSFVRNMLIPNENGQTYLGTSREVAQILHTLPQELLRSNQPQLLEALATPLFQTYFDNQYRAALAMPADSPDRNRIIDALRVNEFLMGFQPRDIEGVTTPPGSKSTSESPEFQRLKQERDNALKTLNQQARQRQQDVVSNLASHNQEQALRDVDKVISAANLNKVYPAELLSGFKGEIHNFIHSKVMGLNGQAPADPGGRQRLDLALQAALRNGGDTTEAKAIYRRMYLNRLQHDPEVKSRLQSLAVNAQAKVDRTIAAAQSAQVRTEPVGTGQPASTPVVSVASQVTRQPAESQADFMARKAMAMRQQLVSSQPR